MNDVMGEALMTHAALSILIMFIIVMVINAQQEIDELKDEIKSLKDRIGDGE